jgi:hypothetical protein
MHKFVDRMDHEISSPYDRPEPEPKLASFVDEREVTAGLYPDQFGDFLWRLAPHIQEDFGSDQIQRLIRVADSLALEETRDITLMVTFRGRRAPFGVRIYKYAAESSHALALYVRTSSTLGKIFEDELKVFFGSPAADPGNPEDPGTGRRIHLHDS